MQWACNNQIIDVDGPRFSPNAAVNRGEAAVLLWKMQDRPPAPAHNFTDVTNQDHHAAVAWLTDANITTGTGTNTFSPDGSLTRAHIVTFLWRLAGEPQAPLHSFTDVTASWQQSSVGWALSKRITTGTSPETFSPDQQLTRAQMLTFLWRYKNQPQVTLDDTSPTCGPNDAARGGDTENEPDTNRTVNEPAASVTITVPAAAPSGRCSAEIALGIYQWEDCAWSPYRNVPAHHYSVSNQQGAELIERIWSEVDVEGKPAVPPTSGLVPAGSRCAKQGGGGGLVIGCYIPSSNHIRLLDSFNDTLLHEVAHALVSGHPSLDICESVTGADNYQSCVHNDIYRCVSDHLYVTYAKIPTSGVCGTTTHSTSGNTADTGTVLHECRLAVGCWETSRSTNGNLYAFTEAVWHNREYPYDDDWAELGVVCFRDSGVVDVYVSVGAGFLAGDVRTNRIPVSYVFWPSGHSDWTEEQQSAWISQNARHQQWNESSGRTSTWMPSQHVESFINEGINAEESQLSILNFDGESFGGFVFNMVGSYGPIRTVTEECGWTWP